VNAGLPAWARISASRLQHVQRVAALADGWASARRTPEAERARWLRAVFLHDALRDAPADLLRELAPEWSHTPALQHGPAAAVMAQRTGEQDQGVLDAVRYHSVGFAGWDEVGRMLYLADYLEPGRTFRQAERQALAARVPGEPGAVLRQVAQERLRWVIDAGRPVFPETMYFWNALVSAGS
jgi:predicted HD superfamily hydrolase involved in NAD metabolism